MTRSLFNPAVAQVFPRGLGESLVSDQVLPAFQMTAREALEKGHDPLDVWQELLRETDHDTPENLFWHRRELKPKPQP